MPEGFLWACLFFLQREPDSTRFLVVGQQLFFFLKNPSFYLQSQTSGIVS